MNPLIEKLLQPVSGDSPSGPDMSYDPRLDELETLLKGKPEIEMGSVVKPAEPPDWRVLKDKSVEFLEVAKHLRVAVMLCAGLSRLDGLPGLRDGLQLIRGLLEGFWDSVHPQLDPDDGNDPMQRLNILSAITATRSAYGLGWLQILDHAMTAPLCRPAGAPPITMDVVVAASQPREPDANDNVPPGPDASTIAMQFQSVSPDQLAGTQAVVGEALEAARGIDAFLTNTLGSSNSISFEELTSTLEQIDRTITAQVAGGGAVAAETPAEVAGDVRAAGGGGGAAVGGPAGGVTAVALPADAIRGRADVVRILEKICDYYRQNEPGSPVPYLLRRAQKLAGMTFFEAVQELAIANVDTLRPSMGSALDAEIPPSEY